MRYKILSQEHLNKNDPSYFVHVFSDKAKAESMLNRVKEVSTIKAGIAEKVGNVTLATELRKLAKGLHIVEF